MSLRVNYSTSRLVFRFEIYTSLLKYFLKYKYITCAVCCLYTGYNYYYQKLFKAGTKYAKLTIIFDWSVLCIHYTMLVLYYKYSNEKPQNNREFPVLNLSTILPALHCCMNNLEYYYCRHNYYSIISPPLNNIIWIWDNSCTFNIYRG